MLKKEQISYKYGNIGEIEIKKTHSTPEVIFEADGNLRLKGRIMTDNAALFFQPIMEMDRVSGL